MGMIPHTTLHGFHGETSKVIIIEPISGSSEVIAVLCAA
jgi:hypothetical protein